MAAPRSAIGAMWVWGSVADVRTAESSGFSRYVVAE